MHRQENEGHDRSTIALPDGQLSLASALSAANTGTPLVCVLIHGGSLAPATLMYALEFKDALMPPAEATLTGAAATGETAMLWWTCGTLAIKVGRLLPMCSSARSRPLAGAARRGTPPTTPCRLRGS